MAIIRRTTSSINLPATSGSLMTETPTNHTIYDFDPRNLPDDVLKAVGLVVCAAAQTESVTQDLIGGLLKIDNLQTRALTAHMAALLKDGIIRALSEMEAPSISSIDRLDELLDQFNDAYKRRNAVAHNALMRHPETGVVSSFRESARGSLQISLHVLDMAKLHEDADQIYLAGMRFMAFMIENGLLPKDRIIAPRAPVDRSNKARTKRRDLKRHQ